MKKGICFLLVFLWILAAFAGCGKEKTSTTPSDATTAETVPTTATPPPAESPAADFIYEVSQDGTKIYINQYVGTAETVVIPDKIDGLPVVSIVGVRNSGNFEKGAFEGSQIQSVTIPESVTSIGLDAFKDCTKLTQVTVSENIKIIQGGAFRNCVALKRMDLSQTKVQIIDYTAFYGCTALTEIKFSNNVTEIGRKAFADCASLVALDFPDSLIKVDEGAFDNCTSLKVVTIPEKLELYSITASSFSNVPALEKIIFKEGRKEIKGYAFFAVTSNPEIVIPKSVETFSPSPFFLYPDAKFVFSGNCPEIVEKNDFYGKPTIYYDPSTQGWDTCIWKDAYSLIPLEK